uniref:Uncharacterized protein n=1 Tax=Xiphophorus maculatus TaxID=8083 RepID=A0A3B5RC24_XIPMA
HSKSRNRNGSWSLVYSVWVFFAPSCRLDRKWVLWHEFMQEHSHLDAWLRLAEQAINTLSPAHLTYSASKEELRRFQRLRSEAGSQLIRLDGLTRRNRTLPQLFQDAVQARLLGAAWECGRRWDEVDAKLETITGRLQVRLDPDQNQNQTAWHQPGSPTSAALSLTTMQTLPTSASVQVPTRPGSSPVQNQ